MVSDTSIDDKDKDNNLKDYEHKDEMIKKSKIEKHISIDDKLKLKNSLNQNGRKKVKGLFIDLNMLEEQNT
jgi:hypothetical protein